MDQTSPPPDRREKNLRHAASTELHRHEMLTHQIVYISIVSPKIPSTTSLTTSSRSALFVYVCTKSKSMLPWCSSSPSCFTPSPLSVPPCLCVRFPSLLRSVSSVPVLRPEYPHPRPIC